MLSFRTAVVALSPDLMALNISLISGRILTTFGSYTLGM